MHWQREVEACTPEMLLVADQMNECFTLVIPEVRAVAGGSVGSHVFSLTLWAGGRKLSTCVDTKLQHPQRQQPTTRSMMMTVAAGSGR